MKSTVGYFTMCDSITQNVMALNGASNDMIMQKIKRNLKLALLFHDKVIIRATALFSSPITAKLFLPDKIINDDDASCLIQAGMLIPEIRAGEEEQLLNDKTLKKILRTDDSREIKKYSLIAETIDSAVEKLITDANDLSDKRTRYFINQIFRLFLHQKKDSFYNWTIPGVSIKKIHETFSMNLPYGGIPPRDKFQNAISMLFSNPNYSTHIFQNVYFLKGAEESGSNPIWSREVDPLNERSIWKTPYPNITELNKKNGINIEERRILEKHGFIEAVETYHKYNFELREEKTEDAWQGINLDMSDIDKITFLQIVKIKNDERWVSFLHAIMDADNIEAEFVKEQKKKERIQKLNKKLSQCVNIINIYAAYLDIHNDTSINSAITSTVKNLAFYANATEFTTKLFEDISSPPIHSFSEFIKTKKYEDA